MSVMIVDYGMGNLGSVKRSFEECGAVAYISNNPKDINHAERIVLPGVGSFPEGMAGLRDRGFIDAISRSVTKYEIPLLGICLGMQLLAETGEEGEKTNGLGLIPGNVSRLQPLSKDERIPHVGWNEVYPSFSGPLFANTKEGEDYYFVHSYHFIPKNPDYILATTPFCKSFVSAIGYRNIYGVQFHPEKSSRNGFQLIKNFINL